MALYDVTFWFECPECAVTWHREAGKLCWLCGGPGTGVERSTMTSSMTSRGEDHGFDDEVVFGVR